MQKVSAWFALALVLGCSREEKAPDPPAAQPAPVAQPSASAVAAVPAAQPQEKRAGPATPPPDVPTKPGTLRLVALTEPEPFTSEKSQLKALQAHIEKGGTQVDAAPATEEERTYLAELTATPEAPPHLPASWAGFETVVILRVEPPRAIGSQKLGGGRSHLAIVHPPTLVPAFSTVYVEKSSVGGTSIDGARLGLWIGNHLKFRKGTP